MKACSKLREKQATDAFDGINTFVACRCRANLEQISQPRPDSGFGLSAKVRICFKLFPFCWDAGDGRV